MSYSNMQLSTSLTSKIFMLTLMHVVYRTPSVTATETTELRHEPLGTQVQPSIVALVGSCR